jgi:hypothetical protein
MRAPHGEQNTNMKGIASKHAAKTHSKSPEMTPGGAPQVIRQSTGQFPDVFRQFHVFLERFGHAIPPPRVVPYKFPAPSRARRCVRACIGIPPVPGESSNTVPLP